MQIREHIADEMLLDYIEQRGGLATERNVRAHLATGCAECQDSLNYWQKMLRVVQDKTMIATPLPVLERAFALFAERQAPVSLRQRVMATLRFDSRVQPELAGARDGDRTSFKLLFEAPNTRIDLLCERSGPDWSIAGQVLSLESKDYLWKVLATGTDKVVRTDADTLGEFHLSGLRTGEYDLLLQERSREITLPAIQL
jgi:hypothetical protein